MKSNVYLIVPLVLLATPLAGFAVEQIIPAGSMIQCTVAEPKISSKTTDVGDPVLCHVGHVELYGHSVFPYGSYLVGRFEDYKDPGHFVGKGWMELKFDRMMIPPNQVLPVSAKVVYVPKYAVDKQGRIHGNGHPVRDAVEWAIPVLWPIDLLNLPRRGPRPVLKAETRLTLKIMDDVDIPGQQQAAAPAYQEAPRDSYNFSQRPMSYEPPPQAAPAAAPRLVSYAPAEPPQQQLTVLMLRDGNGRIATDYWFEGPSQIRYIGTNGSSVVVPMESLDLPRTVDVNRRRGVVFVVRAAAY